MSIVTAKRHPLTPPNAEYGQLGQGNPNMFQSNPGEMNQHFYTLPDHSYLPSGSMTSYNFPARGSRGVDEVGRGYSHIGNNEDGVWRQYDGHNGPTFLSYANGPYSNMSFQHHNYPNPAIHGRPPLASEVSDQAGAGRPTARQGRGLMSNSLSRTPSPRKRRKANKAKNNGKRVRLEKPLSELTKHLEHIPIKDTEAWVNRSMEIRQSEVGDNVHIKRPSNSFILYRSAYADRCREFEKSNNHQDISAMAGGSWAIETPEIRKQYEEWAKLERENHQLAFPNYKFQPLTQEAKARKRKEKSEGGSEETSEAEDPTYHGGRRHPPAAGRTPRNKKPRRNQRESSVTASTASPEDYGTPDTYSSQVDNTSYYHMPNPGKPMPTAIGWGGTYYQATSHPNGRFNHAGHIEDIKYQTLDLPNSIYATPPPVGLPGGSHNDLMGETSLDGGHVMFNNSSLDPELFAPSSSDSQQAEAVGSFHGPPSSHLGGFQANDYLPQHDQLGFDEDVVYDDHVQKWDHFDNF